MTEPVRLSKRLAELLPCSRREAELYIEGGWVSVDGEVVDTPQYKVEPEQRVELLPGASATPQPPVTLLLYKPAGVALERADLQTLLADAQHAPEDRSGIRPLPRHRARLDLLASLETEASGLVVFSQAWGVKRRLTEDATRLEHEFTVDLDGTPPRDALAAFHPGLRYRGRPLPPFKVSWLSEQRLRFALKTPEPGQVRTLCEQAGLTVRAVRRLRIGRVALAGLQPGQWRYLGEQERF
ncbi:RNA pseudouridine synthase [Pseudomonas mangiferae]|uniref:Dual-specificity RNA pseudouridine synthase RluF n=1 Tax=Pseudomonas mangiferae TaxID=2593654 RepID=A0A553GUN8_9PSED|nr:RNA pseudouridine synthase [Pseudomonas mangiferae]TRX73224.1 RNA-binding protein [Pseudomonas mangiferae]